MTSKRTCEDLGVCQARPDCAHCETPYPFAPGVIVGPDYKAVSRMEMLGLSLLVLFGCAALAAIIFLVTGHLIRPELLS